MDPDETLRLLDAALAAGDLSAAREHWDALYTWIERGGYPPTVKCPPSCRKRAECLRCGWDEDYMP